MAEENTVLPESQRINYGESLEVLQDDCKMEERWEATWEKKGVTNDNLNCLDIVLFLSYQTAGPGAPSATCWIFHRLTSRTLASSRWLTPLASSSLTYPF